MANNSNSSIKIQLEITNLSQVRQQIQSLGGAVNLGGGGSSGGNFSGFNFSKSTANAISFDANITALNEFKKAVFSLINPLKEASEAAFKFEASIVATVGTLQATTRILDARGIQVDPGVQLREQFRIATGLEKAGRASLAPIGVGGAEQSLLTNTFIQAQTTKTGVAVSEQDLKTTLPRLVAAIKVLAPNLGETREAKELRDIVLNQRVGQITAGPGIRALAPKLSAARTAEEFEEATRPLEAYITALKEGNTPLAQRLKLEGEFHIIQQDVGEAFNQALLPGLKKIEEALTDPALAAGLEKLASGIGNLVSKILGEVNRLEQRTVRNSTNTNNLIAENKNNPLLRGLFENSFFANLLLPGAGEAIANADSDEIRLKQLQFENAQRRAGKINFSKLKGTEAEKLTSDSSPESKFEKALSGLSLDKEKFNRTTSSDLANLANDPNVQIFQGQELKKAIPSFGLDSESANERSLGALRLIASGQEKVQQNRDRTFASNIPGQIAKTAFDIKSLQEQIATQREIVANRREAVANTTDPLKKGLLQGELNTELDKLREKLKGFGDKLIEAEGQALKTVKAFSDLSLTVQQLDHLFLRQAIARGAADDVKNAAIRDRNNFNAEGPLRNLQRQSAFISAAQKFGEAGGVGFQGGPSGLVGAAASEAAAKGLQHFKDSLDSATKAVNDFADSFEERQDNRATAVYEAQKALDAAKDAPEGDTGDAQAQHQRDVRAAQRALDRAQHAEINGSFDDAKEEERLKANVPSFFQNFLNRNLAGAQLAKEGTTVAQGAEVDAEGLRGKNRAVATAALDQLELSAKQAAESVGLLNQQLAQLQALGLTPASKAADNATASADNQSASPGSSILEEQKNLNKLYGPKVKNGPFRPDSSSRIDAMDLILRSGFKSGGGGYDDGDALGSQPPISDSDTILDRFNNALHGPINLNTPPEGEFTFSPGQYRPKPETPNTYTSGPFSGLTKEGQYGPMGERVFDDTDPNAVNPLDGLSNVGKENPGPAIGKGLGDVFNTWKSAFSKTNPLTDTQNFINGAGKEWQKAEEENKAQERAWDKALNGPARNLMEMKQLAKSLGATDDDFNKAIAVPSTSQLLGPQYAGPVETLSGAQERTSIAAGLFAAVSGTEFEGTTGKTTAKGASIAADLTGAAVDSHIKNFKKATKTFAGISDFDSIFGSEKASNYGKPLTKSDTADAFYDAMNRHFN